MYKILKQCPLFRGLTETQIEEIIDKRGDFTVTEYPDKAVIARKESAYSGLMIILKGKVHALEYKYFPIESEKEIAKLR